MPKQAGQLLDVTMVASALTVTTRRCVSSRTSDDFCFFSPENILHIKVMQISDEMCKCQLERSRQTAMNVSLRTYQLHFDIISLAF